MYYFIKMTVFEPISQLYEIMEDYEIEKKLMNTTNEPWTMIQQYPRGFLTLKEINSCKDINYKIFMLAYHYQLIDNKSINREDLLNATILGEFTSITLFDFCIIISDIDTIKYLCMNGYDIMTSKHTSILLAVTFGSIDIVKLLINLQFDITVTTDDGRTALHIALEQNDTDIIQYIIAMHKIYFLHRATPDTPLWNYTDEFSDEQIHQIIREISEIF